ncbi:LOW QUALITY PROTEIN: doublecortin domain-containing protein 1 [Plakobranchus ocellatus]|uniref:Doublecortin domain-containing protein 1 n=1 Tax=Plakobranchus ocellatus TaxID=259542 RepID=A0AAV3YZM7_9GAST|nr:LOW QUALITY PROTEIN: doublecortin domain-containing protein 1 [Plakobranchus ocellatus]
MVQQGKTPFLGPLWISTGEGFSPSGTQGFLLMVQAALKEKLKAAKKQKAEIDFALDEEKDKVTSPLILSMSADELYEASEKVEDEVEKLKEAVSMVADKLEALKEGARQEEEEGMKYRMTHIQELSCEDRLVGTRGIKLKVFENGRADNEFLYFFNLREAYKGLKNVKDNINQLVLQRLLDELSNTRFSAGANRNLKTTATKLFNRFGAEVTDITKLEQEQSVWISFGEPFICPFTYALQVFLEKATPVTDGKGDQRIVKESMLADENLEKLSRDTSKWEATIGFPALYQSSEDEIMQYGDPAKVELLLEMAEVDPRSHYLLLKDTYDVALYPEIAITEKAHTRNQIFVYNESGYLYCKATPQLCLAVSERKVEATLANRESPMDGFVVCLQKKMVGNPSQIWRCTTDATMYSEAYPSLLLTYLGTKKDEVPNEESYNNLNSGQEPDFGEKDEPVLAEFGPKAKDIYLIVADPLPKKDMAAQRFAFKQERFDNLGQWRHTEASNSEWSKLAYSWPLRMNGELNKDYDWPMEGYLLPNAPPIRKSCKKCSLSGMTPVQLRVMKNGERCADSAVTVVGPNLTNMMKQRAKKDQANKTKKGRGRQIVTTEEYGDEMELHCMDMTVAEMEFQMFLAHVTGVLDLPFAARRLFNCQGKELFTIQGLERGSLVVASCGEEWSDPRLTRMEQKRRFLLSQLSSDVVKMRQYCALRNPEEFVLEISGSVACKSGLVVGQQWNADKGDRSRDELDRGDHNPSASGSKRSLDQQSLLAGAQEDQQAEEETGAGDLSAHQRSHARAEERMNTLKWPWERLVNVNNSLDAEDPEASKYTDKDMYEKFKPQPVPRQSRETLQKFGFEDGFITVSASGRGNSSLVLAATFDCNTSNDFLLCLISEIVSRANQRLVLTVSMPGTALASDGDYAGDLSFQDCPVTLQLRCESTFGKAHQRWRYDAESGLIHAFWADMHDKEITAANQADVCTFAIAQAADIDQPGYEVEIQSPKDGMTRQKVCTSCARAMRGRYKVQKLPPHTAFHCAMGDAKKLKIREVGSFKKLNNKVDLSTFEAPLTLAFWEDTLFNLRKQTSVTTIAHEINAAKTVRTVKVMAYKNGEGRLRHGEIICGSSIEGILGQCAHRLGMTSAARRLYLEDGNLVLDIDELVRYAVECYKTEMVNMVLLRKRQSDNRDLDDLDEEDESVRLARFHEAASHEVSERMQASMDLIMGVNRNKNERGARREERGKGDDDDEEDTYDNDREGEEDSEQKDLDREEAQKIQREREQVLENMKLPPLDIILRGPIEVWVSSGKPFVSPEVVESKEESRRKKRQFRSQVCLALDVDKHVLRQMKGRRLEQMKPGVYRSTLSSTQPVVIENTWQEPTAAEQDKHHSVHKLQTHLGEIRANQQDRQPGIAGINMEGKLYQQPNMKRVMVYPNGESMERSLYVWGASIEQILCCATQKLGLWKNAKTLYTLDGKMVSTFDDIQRDQLLCVSTGKSFQQPANQKVDIEVKANWGRARKQYGSKATDVVVDVQKNPEVDVDPFGPPLLAVSDPPKKISQ